MKAPSPTPVAGSGPQYFGAAINSGTEPGNLYGNTSQGHIPFNRYFNSMQEDNNTVWTIIEPSQGSWSWTVLAGLKGYEAACPGIPIDYSEFTLVDTDDTGQLNETQAIVPALFADRNVKRIRIHLKATAV